MPLIAVPLIVQDSIVILVLAAAVFGAGFYAGLRWNRRKNEKMWDAKMHLHGLS